MFSDSILVQIFSDDRLNGIPLEYQSTVVHVVEDVIDRRFYTDKPFASRESIQRAAETFRRCLHAWCY